MGPSKLEKANKLNIPIISDEDLLQMIGWVPSTLSFNAF
jgi:BRCT domain type II-containing protein